ncbi:MAG TPA: D-alanine--D-alanine ligase [Actinomycetota bacterium]|jgi:D-alanine-D-alanine ligase|nr:D-alanine--D-alanine ligase [Actinomycetota bacterium]
MRIAIVAGGRTPERDVSLRGGHRVETALASLGHDAWTVDPAERKLVEALRERPLDLCWLALHGKEGEDGTVQRLLDLEHVAYVGTRALDCELTFDKVLAKDVLRRANVPTPDWVVIEGSALRDLGAGASLATAVERVGLPCVVKPSRSGSALGVAVVERAADLAAAVMAALSYSDAAIVERRVSGTEVAAGAIGDPLEQLPLVEVEPKDGVYDYGARYTAGATDYWSPARLEPATAAAASDAAARTLGTLGIRSIGRVDLIIDEDGEPWVLEANVSPGMTETSLVPMAAAAAGLSLAHLCDRVIRSMGSD